MSLGVSAGATLLPPTASARTARSACYGARWWVTLIARQVHQADAANLPRTKRARRPRERCNAEPTVWGRLMKTARERAEEKRREKLEFVAEQVENGQLVIRQMTEEERRRYPPLPSQAKPPAKR
jgi:hypothetical protein